MHPDFLKKKIFQKLDYLKKHFKKKEICSFSTNHVRPVWKKTPFISNCQTIFDNYDTDQWQTVHHNLELPLKCLQNL